MNMARNWWKFLSASLVLTTLFIGLTAPLAPGIAKVQPERLSYGVNSVEIQGYNTHFAEAKESMQVWLSNGKQIFCPFELVVLNNEQLRLTFSIPESVEEAFFELYLNNDQDGTLGLQSAFLQQGLSVVEQVQYSDTAMCITAMKTEEAAWFNFPNQSILNETIRNLFFHVPSWFAMMLLMTLSLVYSIKYLRNSAFENDLMAANFAKVGLLFAAVGLLTGSVWARFTWGAWWVSDPRLNGAALGVLVYLAYFVLKSSVNDDEKAARLGAVYNIFAYVMMMLFIMVLPRMTDSLHPGVGGNPAFSQYDLDDNMRMVFYPAVLGWMGMAIWISQLRNRMDLLAYRKSMASNA
jgi:heme exporter protein C